MNLRQKVKKAKKDMLIAEKEYSGSTSWDIYQKFMITSKLQEIIDYKRKPSSIFNWNEDKEVDSTKLTYISLEVNYQSLLKVVSPNGKPFTKKQVNEFLSKAHLKIYNYGLEVQERPKGKEYVDYELLLSDYRTKQKKFLVKKIYRQHYGGDKLYAHN